jgi:hypothetical protein
VTAESAGLKVVAALDRLEVAGGGTVEVDLRIENTRATDVLFLEPCDDQAMTVSVRVRNDPIGHDWTGIGATFKAYSLAEGAGSPMESSTRTATRIAARPDACHAPRQAGTDDSFPIAVIAAGTTYQTRLRWTAEIVRGVAAIPGPAPFSIQIAYDPEAAARGMIHAETLAVSGSITVVEGAPTGVSSGEALDAVIADPTFATWLRKQRPASWANANLYLQPAAIGVKVLPAVPYWAVELFREPRNWAIFYVDAMSGAVLKGSFCNIPCDR